MALGLIDVCVTIFRVAIYGPHSVGEGWFWAATIELVIGSFFFLAGVLGTPKRKP